MRRKRVARRRRQAAECDLQGNWTARDDEGVCRELSRVYGVPLDISAKRNGLEVVAKALQRGETARAQIAALLLKLPDPPLGEAINIESRTVWRSRSTSQLAACSRSIRTGTRSTRALERRLIQTGSRPSPRSQRRRNRRDPSRGGRRRRSIKRLKIGSRESQGRRPRRVGSSSSTSCPLSTHSQRSLRRWE